MVGWNMGSVMLQGGFETKVQNDWKHWFLEDIINPYNCLLKSTNFSVKTSNE